MWVLFQCLCVIADGRTTTQDLQHNSDVRTTTVFLFSATILEENIVLLINLTAYFSD